MLIRDGYDLFLTSNGVVLIYDDIALKYIHIVRQFPYLGLNVFSSTVWTLPSWSSGTLERELILRQKYEGYLSSDEISKYLENDELVEWRIPNSTVLARRQSAWEFMGQPVPEKYMFCTSSLFDGRRRAEVPSGSVSAEVGVLKQARLRHRQALHHQSCLMWMLRSAH